MSEHIPKMKLYPLELWFPEWQYSFDKAQEVAKRYEELYGVQYYCQLLRDWICCHVLDGSSDTGSDARPGGKRLARSLKDLIDML